MLGRLGQQPQKFTVVTGQKNENKAIRIINNVGHLELFQIIKSEILKFVDVVNYWLNSCTEQKLPHYPQI